MDQKQHEIDFTSVLAATVHDMKNSLCLLLQTIESLSNNIAEESTESADLLANMQYEATRLNTDLMQLLSLYRAEKDNLPVNLNLHYVQDVVDELVAANQSYISNKNIQLNIEQDEELSWYLDSDLIHLLLNDVLINAMRYGKERIQLKAFRENNWLFITIEDDGDGYPPQMLETNEMAMHEFNIEHGRTGLGLYFARMIAEAHSQPEQPASIKLTNGGAYGGSVFTLKLP